MLWFYRFIIGYLLVEFKGDISESIINISAHNGISLWGMKKKGEKISGYLSVKDFKLLPKLLYKKRLRFHIVKKIGLPFIIKRYNKRYGIAVGAVLFFSVLKIMSMFIWSIDVVGAQHLSDKRVISACKNIGIETGIRKNKIDTKLAKQNLILELDEISWASFNIEGSRLSVNITEASKISSYNNKPCNLISSENAKITNINVKSGNSIVRVGDTVAKGDVLISGVMENNNKTEFVSSAGKVIGETKKDYTVTSYYERTINKPNNNNNIKYMVEFFGLHIPLYLGNQIGLYETEFKKTDFNLFGNRLPISVYSATFKGYDEIKATVNKKSIIKELETKLKNKISSENPVNYIIEQKKINQIKGGAELQATVLIEKNICEKNILLFSIEK